MGPKEGSKAKERSAFWRWVRHHWRAREFAGIRRRFHRKCDRRLRIEFTLEEARGLDTTFTPDMPWRLALPDGRFALSENGRVFEDDDVVAAEYVAKRVVAEMSGEPIPPKPMLDWLVLYRYREFITPEEREFMQERFDHAERHKKLAIGLP